MRETSQAKAGWGRFHARGNVPANRLLIVADAKMLPALASGLRDGGKFEVLTAALSDRAAAQAAVEQADAVALFYGAPGAPLTAAVQALAPKLRERGGRLAGRGAGGGDGARGGAEAGGAAGGGSGGEGGRAGCGAGGCSVSGPGSRRGEAGRDSPGGIAPRRPGVGAASGFRRSKARPP